MEDLSLEDLIADVVANPTPERVSCRPVAPTQADEVPTPTSTGLYRTIRRFAGRIRRRIARV